MNNYIRKKLFCYLFLSIGINIYAIQYINIESKLPMNSSIINKKKTERTKHCTVIDGVPLPENSERGGHAGGIINGKVIITGGTSWNKEKTSKKILSNSLIFENGQWAEGPSLPIPLAYSAFCHNETGLYIAGGTSDGNVMSKDVYVLRGIHNNNTWEKLPCLPEGVGFGSGTILDNKFYVSGGTTNIGHTEKMWMLDITQHNKGWVECKSIPGEQRILHALVSCGKYLYVVGGLARTIPLTPLSDILRYDPEKDEWDQLDNLPFNGYGWAAQPLDEYEILITGRANGMVHKEIWTINLKTGIVNKIGSLTIQSTTAPLLHVSEGKWWLVGGEPDSNKTRTGKVSIIKLERR